MFNYHLTKLEQMLWFASFTRAAVPIICILFRTTAYWWLRADLTFRRAMLANKTKILSFCLRKPES